MNDPRQAQDPGPLVPTRYVRIAIAAAVILFGLLLVHSARRSLDTRGPRRAASGADGTEASARRQLFAIAVDGLNRLEESDSREKSAQVVDRLNQWSDSQKPIAGWTIDPMVRPRVETAAKFASQLRPASAALEKPRDILQMKQIASRLALVPAQVERWGRETDPERLEEFAAKNARTIREIGFAAKQFETASRLEEVEAAVDAAFEQQVKDIQKLAKFRFFLVLARQLDRESRLQDAAQLIEFADQLDAVMRSWDRRELEKLTTGYSRVADAVLGGVRKTKTQLEVEAVLALADQTKTMRQLAQLRDVQAVVEAGAERLKDVARRLGRSDVAAVAARFVDARKRLKVEDLKAAADALTAAAKPWDFAEWGVQAEPLSQAAKELRAVASQAADFGAKQGMPKTAGLQEYVTQLAKQCDALADMLRKPPASGAKKETVCDEAAAAYFGVEAQVRSLVDGFSYMANVESLKFPPEDYSALQQGALIRDVARWARGDEPDDLSRAKRLFDWTVRNIRLTAEPAPIQGKSLEIVMLRPWEAILTGQGTPGERAWTFVLLARQVGIDAAVLAVEDPKEKRLKEWAVAVLCDGQAYLFDPSLGLPIPAPGGIRLTDDGAVEVRPATLAQVVADASILRKLDLDASHPYPVTAEQLKRVVAWIEADVPVTAQRMKLVESQLAGNDRMSLYSPPTPHAERFKACKGIAGVDLWNRPWETRFFRMRMGTQAAAWQSAFFSTLLMPAISRGAAPGPTAAARNDAPIFWERDANEAAKQAKRSSGGSDERRDINRNAPLWRGRVFHLKGRLVGEESAAEYYQVACPTEKQLQSVAGTQAGRQLLGAFTAVQRDAAYWLGVNAFDQGNYPSAENWLKNRLFKGGDTVGEWTGGARYLLGRSYELMKKPEQAFEQYTALPGDPSYHGNHLRARWLAELTKTKFDDKVRVPAAKPAPKPTTPSTPDLPDLPGLPDESPAKPEPKKDAKPAAK